MYPDIFEGYYLEEAKESNWTKIIEDAIQAEVKK